VVYGAAIGLGFGMTENFLYFLNTETMKQWFILVPMRSILSAVMHACSTSAAGAFVGYSKFQAKKKKTLLILLGLLTAMVIHFIWNFSVTFGSGKLTLVGILFIFISVLIMFALLKSSLSVESKLIKKELTEESGLGLIPANHLNYLPYTHLRNRTNWLPKNINRLRYIKIATTLAFRKYQYKNCSESQKAFYEKEVEDAREKIGYILYGRPI
jgi:multisubunit Na+/H+ antiporter MnhE subunit